MGWACYIVAVEPDVGYPLLRAFGELVPRRVLGPARRRPRRSILASR